MNCEPIQTHVNIKVLRIDETMANHIIENKHEKMHKGLFYILEKDRTFTCIDNREGEACTENFQLITNASKWLLGLIEISDVKYDKNGKELES